MRLSERIRMARAVRRAHSRCRHICLVCRYLRSCWEEVVEEVEDLGS